MKKQKKKLETGKHTKKTKKNPNLWKNENKSREEGKEIMKNRKKIMEK